MGEKFSGLNVLDGNGGLQSLTPTPYTISQWPWGTVPKLCYDTSVNNKYCNPYDLEVYDVRYTDVGKRLASDSEPVLTLT